MSAVRPTRLLLAVLPLALAACATTGAGSASKSPPPGHKLVIQPARGVNPSPPMHRPKTSPYAPAQEDLSKRGDYVAGGLYAPGVRDTVPDHIPDVDSIPEPEVRVEPRARTGNRSYSVLGKQYSVMDSGHGYVEQGGASYYGKKFHGRRTSSGEVYDMYAFTAAHKTLPLPSYARVTNLDNGKSLVVKINDRGPFHPGRVIDLSYAAAVKLGYRDRGTARVEVRALLPGEEGLVRTRAGADATAMDQLVEALPQALAAAGPVQPAPAKPVDTSYRFDMQQNGRTMNADEFDAWMKSRRVRVATGKPGQPDAATKPMTTPLPATATIPSARMSTSAPVAVKTFDVVLQVASFASQDNAGRALAMLQAAGIGAARLQDAQVNGQKLWRLRVGPLDGVSAVELSSRISGLGFGAPRIVRD